MGLTLTEKILKAHVIDGEFVKGKEIGIKIPYSEKHGVWYFFIILLPL